MQAIHLLFDYRPWAMDVVVYTPSEAVEHREYRNSLMHVIETEGKVLYEQPG